jgi:hypothetical protein
VIDLTTSKLRRLLTQGLSDAELTRVLFDHFREVHTEVGDAPKHTRIQALLEHVTIRGRQQELLAAISEINKALAEETWEPMAA